MNSQCKERFWHEICTLQYYISLDKRGLPSNKCLPQWNIYIYNMAQWMNIRTPDVYMYVPLDEKSASSDSGSGRLVVMQVIQKLLLKILYG